MNLYIKHASEIEIARVLQFGIDADKLSSLAMGHIPTEGAAQVMFGAELDTPPPKFPPECVLDLHESWHILHFLLTGEASGGRLPGAFLLMGRQAGRQPGWHAPRVLTFVQTAELADLLSGLTTADLLARIDTTRMDELSIHGMRSGQGVRSAQWLAEEVQHYFPPLVEHVTVAAERRMGLIIWRL